MNHSLEQSVKERLYQLSKDRETSFSDLWRHLILERFLARLCKSPYKNHFVLKGGTLLARYILLGRETKDLDFLVEKLSNAEQSLNKIIGEICSLDLQDSFYFQDLRVDALIHPHMSYKGATVTLLAKFGSTKTHLSIDLGFGDIVHAIDQSLSLTSTKKGPLFESHIQIRCYPKEFIFAEKLETVVFRGSANSRMKDFHDLYSLVTQSNCLNAEDTEKAVTMVFLHRKTSLRDLPLVFDSEALDLFQAKWAAYHRGLVARQLPVKVPKVFSEVVVTINQWLNEHTEFCGL